MAQSKHPVLRVVVPLLVVAAGIAIGWGMLVSGKSGNTTPPVTPPASAANADASKAAPGAAAGTPAPATPQPATNSTTPTTSPPAPAPAPTPSAATNPPAPAPAASIAGLHAKVQAGASLELSPIGNLTLDPKLDDKSALMRLAFDPAGAGISELALAGHYTSVEPKSPNEVLQRSEAHRVVDAAGKPVSETKVVPMALLGVMINGQFVSLTDINAGPIWKQAAPGRFEAEIVDGAGEPVAQIVRAFELSPGSYDVIVRQSLKNLTGAPLNVQWIQLGPTEVPDGTISYGGDMRRVRLGYLPGATSNPSGQIVLADRFLMPHAEAVGKPVPSATGTAFPEITLWPPKENPEGVQLAFAGLTSRYFSAVVHPLPDMQKRADGQPDKSFRGVASVDRVLLDRSPFDPDAAERIRHVTLALRLTGPTVTVAPGQSMDASMGLYAGPTETAALSADPRTKAMQMENLVLFTMGGPCAFCTFQPIAHLLHGVLVFLHNNIFHDWALAVIFLVVCVRTILHPVTRWSQTNLTRFGKQMAAIAPKQAKLKEKYGHDPKLLQQEVAKLMREENVNYAGMLGCIPAVLQTPIWIALYAMISFSFELRHQPAFYGVFQAISGGKWQFLSDMSLPDRFIPFGSGFTIPLINAHINAFNLLPLLLGVVFYIQQKYLTPPTSSQLTPEQETTQKITKVMMVVMFPVFMYNSPAALTLYFLTNSSLGILESKWIRNHVDRLDAEAEKLKQASNGRRVEPKKPGFFQRLQERVAEVQAQREQVMRQQAKKKK